MDRELLHIMPKAGWSPSCDVQKGCWNILEHFGTRCRVAEWERKVQVQWVSFPRGTFAPIYRIHNYTSYIDKNIEILCNFLPSQAARLVEWPSRVPSEMRRRAMQPRAQAGEEFQSQRRSETIRDDSSKKFNDTVVMIVPKNEK